MTKKQKKTLYRIIISTLLLIALQVLLHFVDLPIIVEFILYMIPYAVIGYDILKKAFHGITHGQVFDECFLVKSLPDLSQWNTSNVENMSFMFNGLHSITSLPDISNWDVSNVENMNEMFRGCKSLTSLDISNWDVSNVTYAGGMFAKCNSLPQIFRNVKDKESLLACINWCKENY